MTRWPATAALLLCATLAAAQDAGPADAPADGPFHGHGDGHVDGHEDGHDDGLPMDDIPNDDAHDDAAATLTLDTAPQQATIALSCRFTVECVEDQACTANGFGARLDGRAGGLDAQSMVAEVTLVHGIGAVELLGVREGTALSLAGGRFEARHLVTVTDTGDARYTIHYIEGPLMVSYLGRCEED